MNKTVLQVVLVFLLLGWRDQAVAGGAAPERALHRGDFVAASAGFSRDAARHFSDPDWIAGAARMALYDNQLDDAERLYRQLAAHPRYQERSATGLAAIAERRGAPGTFLIEQTMPRVEIGFDASAPLPVISVTLGEGRVAHFLIDTGAPGIVIDPALATELGLPIEDGGEGVFGGGAHGKIERTVVPRLAFAGLSVRAVPAIVMPLAGAPVPDGMKVEGIVGTSFFYHFLTTLDFKRQRLILQPREHSSAFQKEAAVDGAVSARMWYVPDHFIFARARVNRKLDGLFNIDTGGTGFGIQATKKTIAAARIGLDTRHPGQFATPGGDVKTLPFSAHLTFCGKQMQAEGIYFPDGEQYAMFPFEVAGTLSEGVFRHGALTFDFVAMRLTLRSD